MSFDRFVDCFRRRNGDASSIKLLRRSKELFFFPYASKLEPGSILSSCSKQKKGKAKASHTGESSGVLQLRT
jgi:hypothetical protein